MNKENSTERSKQKGDAELAFGVLLILGCVLGAGFLLAETQTTNACRNFGKFSSLGNVYECKKVEQK